MWIRDHRVAGDVVRVVGLPPYFQWEDFPQPVYPPPLHTFMITGEKMVDAADGFMLHTVEELEMEAHKDMIQWVRPRRVLCFGPQLPPALLSENAHSSAETLAKLDVNFNASPASDLADCRNDASNAAAGEKLAVDPTIAFLDKALEKYGVHSALYVSFGSMLFPPEAHMKALIETLLNLENPLPFIIPISTGSIPEDMKTAMEQSGRGLVVQWAPQQAILSHPALGWMITHCGGGGMFESLSSGVPVIAWPFMVDQHQHALWISQVLDTGFELLQVRTGTPGRPALRGDNPGGILILGTDEAIRNEIRDTLERA
ncbi:UDP-Glycosyltransferase/glycogen phosphorylase, partial [Dacryopinax primogenitus]